MSDPSEHFIPEPQAACSATMRRRISIGLPSPKGSRERRFPLTPEAVGVLTDRGYEVRMQSGGSASIHYDDTAYMRHGARITDRTEAFEADLVITLAPLSGYDIRTMRRGAMLLTLLHSVDTSPDTVRELLRRNIVTIAIDLLGDPDGHTPFADILSEIDGRAAMAMASAMLASPNHGKGILLGGVAGINPCEVLILGLGATVRMLDNDVYRLRQATGMQGGAVATSVMHPRVLENALRTADVVVATPMREACTISAEQVNLMKRGVILMDLNPDGATVCPSLPAIDITATESMRAVPPGTRICYTCIGNTVPRTAAMALGNTFLSLLHDMMECDGAVNTVRLLPGVQRAVVTFMGKPVNSRIAMACGMRAIDIALLINCI